MKSIYWLVLGIGAMIFLSRRQSSGSVDQYGAAETLRSFTGAYPSATTAALPVSTWTSNQTGKLQTTAEAYQERLVKTAETALNQGQDRPTASAELSFLANTVQQLKAAL